MTEAANQQHSFDVVGIGALNLDYVATTSLMAADERVLSVKRASAAISDEAPVVEWGTERLVDAPTMRAAMGEIDVTALVASPGGSAFNAVHTLASADTGLRLGYVGVSGVLPVPGITAHEHLDQLGVDRSWVEVDLDRLGGVCLSIMGSGERTLLVRYAGAAGHARFAEIARSALSG